MKEANKDLPRAPRDWWEKTLFALILVLPSTIYPFAKAFSTTVTPLGTSLVVAGTLIGLLLLSIFRHVGPTFVEKREAAYQNRHAAEIYSIPVTVVKRERQKTELGKIWCYRVDPGIFGTNRLIEGEGSMSIWFADTPQRTPVRAVVKFKYGKFDIRIQDPKDD